MKAKTIKGIIYGSILLELGLIINAFIIKVYINYDDLINYITLKSKISFIGFEVPSDLIQKYIPSKNFLINYNEFFGWYHVREISHLFYYVNHFIFLTFLLLFLIIFKNKFSQLLEKLINWSKIKENRKPRKIIFYCTMFLILMLISKAHTALFFGGISGWDNNHVQSAIKPKLEIPIEDLDYEIYYEDAIIKENSFYIDKSGFISGRGYFMHFSDGEILPFNLGILNAIFPELQYPIGTPKYMSEEFKCKIIDHLKYSLNKEKTPHILGKFRYPNHTPYMKIDYKNYPDSDLLESISAHDIYVHVSDRKLKIIGGKLIESYKCQDIKK